MFVELLPLLKTAKITAQFILQDDGEILVLMLPEKKDGQNPLLATPMRFKGTAQDLQANLGKQLTELLSAREAIVVSVETQIEELKAKAKEMVAGQKEAKSTEPVASQTKPPKVKTETEAKPAKVAEKPKPEVPSNPWG